MVGFFDWLQDTDLAVWVSESDWGYPILLCFHAIGLAIVVGLSFVICARLLGYSRGFPPTVIRTLMGIAWVGFLINFVSGFILFMSKPWRFFATWTFDVKLFMILFAVISIFLLTGAMKRDKRLIHEGIASLNTKIIAAAILFFWFGAIITGRLIGYTIAPPTL